MSFVCYFRTSFAEPNKYRTSHAGNPKPPLPFNLTLQKGVVNVALKRDFVKYVTADQLPLDLFNWMYDMVIPEESFFSTLATVERGEGRNITQNLEKNTTHGLVIQN